ncbi:MAG TPA: DUF4082 domain-containing protein [Longimicrobium sp.]|nr:DUF4082 domain-containing protein [Longimicrobium sp.]
MQIKRFMMGTAAALVLAACGDTESANPMASAEGGQGKGPALATAPVGARWSLYDGQTPSETLDATPGWEVGTRLTTNKRGKVIGFRFYRASGETGTNTARLWTNSGQQLASASFSAGGTGWQTVYLPANSAVSLTVNTTYRVSVNTNTAQVKTGGGYAYNGNLSSGPLFSDGGYYGQPTGSMPTSSSASYFFVDVIFEEYVPLPNLYVGGIYLGGTDYWGNEIATLRVCNNGDGAAGASTTRMKYFWANSGPWQFQWDRTYATAAIAAGSCTDLQVPSNSASGSNLYEVFADTYDVLYESNEGDNFSNAGWNRWP